jgi:hypothetical protein
LTDLKTIVSHNALERKYPNAGKEWGWPLSANMDETLTRLEFSVE